MNMRRSIALVGLFVAVFATQATADPIGQVSCRTFDEHDLTLSQVTFNDENNDGKLAPGETVQVQFSYNLPACTNAVDHSMHVFSFYDGDGDFLGKKIAFYSVQGNWDSYTFYSMPLVVPDYNTSTITVEIDIYGNSVHGSDVYVREGGNGFGSEKAYDKVIRDTIDTGDNFNDLPLPQDDINMLQNTREEDFDDNNDCVTLDYTINENSYVNNKNNPGIYIAQGAWSMDSGGSHPCYYYNAWEEIKAMYNWEAVIDTSGVSTNIGVVKKGGTCGPNPNERHNGGGEILNNRYTFDRPCKSDDEWISTSEDLACDSGTLKDASNYDGSIIEIDNVNYVSDGSDWLSEERTDSSQNVCQAFVDAQGSGQWATGTIQVEASGLQGARCNLPLTNDKFIVDKTLYTDGSKVACTAPGGTKENITIKGTTYYCRGFK